MSQKITPFLWFDGQAEQAAKFYTSIFTKAKIVTVSSTSARFRLEGLEFIAFNGGPQFKFTPAISLFVSCKTRRKSITSGKSFLLAAKSSAADG